MPQNKDQAKTSLLEDIEDISRVLCLAVDGNFKFRIDTKSENESIQKLGMLINFVLDSARRALAELKQKNQELAKLDELKSDFLANISHELRTPLTLILGPIDTILNDTGMQWSKDEGNTLKIIYNNACRMLDLVNNLLDISKADAGKYEVKIEPINILQYVKNIVDEIKPIAKQNKLSLVAEHQGDDKTLALDSYLLERILMNLVVNAIKFTHENGTIKINTKIDEDFLHLSVTDTGIGIPSDKLDKLFNRFEQVDTSRSRRYSGTGIGLTLVKQFCGFLGGEVTVESEEGKGSRFSVKIPALQFKNIDNPSKKIYQTKKLGKEFLSSTKNLIDENKTKLQSIKHIDHTTIDADKDFIVIAEDNPEIRQYLQQGLEKDYNVVGTNNGKVALEATQQYSPCAVIADVMMPVIDGIKLASLIKKNKDLEYISIILLTAISDHNDMILGLEQGADDYLVKPFSLNELKARVKSAVRMSKAFKLLKKKNKDIETSMHQIKSLNKEIMDISRQSGMAEIASNVLHNVGNVLNTINVSLDLLKEKHNDSCMSKVINLLELFKENNEKLSTAFECDKTASALRAYIPMLHEKCLANIEEEKKAFNYISENLNLIKSTITTQQQYAKNSILTEKISLNKMIDDFIELQDNQIKKHHIQINKHYDSDHEIIADKHGLIMVFTNLMNNAIDALLESGKKEKIIDISISNQGHNILMHFQDNGIGMTKDVLAHIFQHGYTTKKSGHGFGLHSAALTINNMGGRFLVNSAGTNLGSKFTLTIPKQPK